MEVQVLPAAPIDARNRRGLRIHDTVAELKTQVRILPRVPIAAVVYGKDGSAFTLATRVRIPSAVPTCDRKYPIETAGDYKKEPIGSVTGVDDGADS